MRGFVVALVAVPRLVNAEPAWSLDASATGTGSFELRPAPPSDQPGVVPAILCRVEHRLGPLFVGGTFEGGIPAWYGEVGVALSVDVEPVVHRPECAGGTCAPTISLGLGADYGASYYFFDSGTLEYWGPIVRARAELRVMWKCPNEACPDGHDTAFGVVVGASTALTNAHYDGGGIGLRLEPGVEVGLALRL